MLPLDSAPGPADLRVQTDMDNDSVNRLPAPRRRKYAMDEHYFDVVDTPEKAYWLGFIAGDGCVRPSGALQVNLATVDIGHLQKLAAALGTESPVRHGTTRLNGKTYSRVRLVVCSVRLARGLEAQGIVPRKTWGMEPWDGPADLMPHYWRGLVDADGTLIPVSPWAVSLVGLKPVVSAFNDWMRGVYPSARITPRPRVGILWAASISGRLGAQAVAGALYGDGAVALDRKADRAMAILAAMPLKGPATGDRSPEARVRRSAFHAGQVPSRANLDARRTPEARERARQRKLGSTATDTTRRRMSESMLLRYDDPAVREMTRQVNRQTAERSRAEREAAGLASPPRNTSCRTCGADISHRSAQARHCERCSRPKATRGAGRAGFYTGAKLTEDKVREIRSRGSERASDLAAEYGISADSIYELLSGRTWKHVA